MKLLIILSVVWLGMASAAEPRRTLGVTSASGGKRVALVIGNAAYPGVAALKNSANDARDIGAKLKKLGFDVTVRTDIRYREMLRSLTEFGDKVQPGTEALFFYAGHGMQVRGRNYLIPLDAEIRTEASVSSEAVDVDQLLDKLAPARLSMVILDACRNNPFERRFRGSGQGLASINAPTGTLIAYATAPGKVAADGEGRNGLYTSELLKAMDVPDIKIEDVFKRVRANVVKKSGDAQTPWESSSLTGDFYFHPTKLLSTTGSIATEQMAEKYPVTSGGKEAASIQDAEILYWQSISSSLDGKAFRDYLARYPEGQFREIAEGKIKSLGQASAIPLAIGETSAWAGPDGGKFSLKLTGGNRFLLTGAFKPNDQIIVIYEQHRAPVEFEIPLAIAGEMMEGRIIGEFLQKASFHDHWKCSAPERRGPVTGSFDFSAGTMTLAFERTLYEFQTKFKSFFSSEFVCALGNATRTNNYQIQLRLTGKTYFE